MKKLLSSIINSLYKRTEKENRRKHNLIMNLNYLDFKSRNEMAKIKLLDPEKESEPVKFEDDETNSETINEYFSYEVTGFNIVVDHTKICYKTVMKDGEIITGCSRNDVIVNALTYLTKNYHRVTITDL